MEDKKLNYIKDCEIDLGREKSDLLGTRCYADTILQMIKDSSFTPFTIGLFGGWGSGKSSIIKTIKEKLNGDKKNKTKVFVYDAWKYSKDSFRRTFILELMKEFGLERSKELETFYNEKHEEIKGKIDVTLESVIIFIGLFLIFILFLTLIQWLGNKFTGWSAVALSNLSGSAITAAVLTLLLGKIFPVYKNFIIKPRMFAPEQFEDVFLEVIDKITGKKRESWKYIKNTLRPFSQIEKLVIVIDNIDRCDGDLAIELLLTIKNFLGREKVIFIIPIGEEEIRKHLTTKGYDTNEFLRKFLNTTIRIKKFPETDLYEYAKALISKYSIDLHDDLVSLVAQGFSKNPRQIIQFLNMLQNEILLLKEQEKSGNIPLGTADGNLPFLTKILLIREEWFELYQRLEDAPHLLDRIDKWLKEGAKDEVDKWLKEGAKKADKCDEEFKCVDDPSKNQIRFLERTRHITSNTPELFFTNRDSFRDVPDDLYKYVISQDWKEIKNILERKRITFDDLIEFIDDRYRNEVKDRGLIKTTGVNVFSLVFKIASDEEYSEKFKQIYCASSKQLGEIRTYLNSSDIKEMLTDFNAGDLLKFSKSYLSENEALLDEIVQFLNAKEDDNESWYELLESYISSFISNLEYLEKVGDKFSAFLHQHLERYKDFKDKLQKKEVMDCLIKESLLQGLIEPLDPSPEQNDTELKVSIIRDLKESKAFSDELTEKFFSKATEFLEEGQSNTNKFWADVLKDFVPKIQNEEIYTKVFKSVESKFPEYESSYENLCNDENYQDSCKSLLSLSAELYKLELNDECDKRIENWLASFFRPNGASEIYIHVNKIYFDLVDYFGAWNWPFSQAVINKFNQVTEWGEKEDLACTLNLMVEKTGESEDGSGLKKEQLKDVFLCYVDVYREVSDQEKSKILEWINLLTNNTSAKQEIIEEVKSFDRNKKLETIEIIKSIGEDSLLQESVDEIVADPDCANLNNAMNRFRSCSIEENLIRSSIEKVLKTLEMEDDEEYFQCFLDFVAGSKLADQKITGKVATKIRVVLSKLDESKVISLLKILDKFDNLEDIDADQKQSLKSILVGLNLDFDDEGQELFERVKNRL